MSCNYDNVFQEHFDSAVLSVTVKEDAREFTGLNDKFGSDLRKLELKMKKDDKEEGEELNVVVKTTPQTAFQRTAQHIFCTGLKIWGLKIFSW